MSDDVICRLDLRLVDDGGPLDVMRNDGVIGEGGIAGVESRWLEEASEDERQGYRRNKGRLDEIFVECLSACQLTDDPIMSNRPPQTIKHNTRPRP